MIEQFTTLVDGGREPRARRFAESMLAPGGCSDQDAWELMRLLASIAVSSAELFPGISFSRIEGPTPTGWSLSNPSVHPTAPDGRAFVRLVNYRGHWPDFYVHDRDGIIRTLPLMADFDSGLHVTGIRSLHDATTVGHSDLFVIRGFEDWRLFEHGGHEYAVASMLSANHEGRSQQFLLRLDGDTVVDATPLSRPTDGHQKNWMPVIGSDPMMFVDRCSPLRLRTFDTRTGECSVVDPGVVIPIAAPFRGGSQLVPWGNGYLAVVHEVAGDHTGRRTYLHRFVAFDQDCCPTACTDQFWIVRRGVEFSPVLPWPRTAS